MKTKPRRLLLTIGSVLLILLVLGLFKDNGISLPNKISSQSSDKSQTGLSSLPRFVHHNCIELEKIAKISKFRSGVGHDFSRGNNETNSCRSMKHYFEPVGIDELFWSRYHNGNISRSDWPEVRYFAPVSGTITDMRPARNMFGEKENQFILVSEEYPDIRFGFFHVITKDGLDAGSRIKAGELLGTISPGNSGEIAVSVNAGSDEQLISFFELVDSTAFSEYSSRGIKSTDELIITKRERDKNPLYCDDKEPFRFIGSSNIPDNKERYDTWSMGESNWVFLDELPDMP